jgi:hypothetical protein
MVEDLDSILRVCPRSRPCLLNFGAPFEINRRYHRGYHEAGFHQCLSAVGLDPGKVV